MQSRPDHKYYQENISMPPDMAAKIVPIEPVRRPSRASKKTPTTILNASTSNFRALVQQFTGCQTRASLPYKGPINLNFSMTNQQNDFLSPSSTPVSVKSQTQQQLQEDHKLLHQEAASVSTLVSNPGPLTLDDFDIDNNIYFQELVPPPRDYSLSDNTYDDFWGY
ncbi:dendritic arbor reduction protein 1-like [Abeliophyllum distichum]|uniref:Dendritic arbor reduction protein 1-like n=1 Tax=Abeliophyllum distichum TaxID=126358 RepID=A0ABD1PY73_9LAMI